jgi:hypothetical protein
LHIVVSSKCLEVVNASILAERLPPERGAASLGQGYGGPPTGLR